MFKERKDPGMIDNFALNNLSLSLFFFIPFRVTPTAYGSSRARGHIGASAEVYTTDADPSNAKSKPHLRPMPLLSAMLDP